jgi:hypothetical protein
MTRHAKCAQGKVLRADVRRRVAPFGERDCAFRSIQVAQKMKTGLVALSAGSLAEPATKTS